MEDRDTYWNTDFHRLTRTITDKKGEQKLYFEWNAKMINPQASTKERVGSMQSAEGSGGSHESGGGEDFGAKTNTVKQSRRR